MVLIPNDVGLRLRTELDSHLRPVTPVGEIPVELPDLRPGTAFSARIQEVLPENTYKALVAGKSLTLSLPEGAKAGDTLELMVVDRTPRTVVARLASPASGTLPAETQGSPTATLSRAGQLIASLLTEEGQAPPSAPLTRGAPLMAPDRAEASQLAPQLAKAVAQSGLFYESHQAQWLMGQHPVDQLLAEPQGRHSHPDVLTAFRRAAVDTKASAEPGTPPPHPDALSTSSEAEALPAIRQETNARVASHVIPEDIKPLVQQQLDTATTQRLVWHGEAWPNQPFDWQIEREKERGSESEDGDPQWRTSLSLTTPHLGRIEARLRVSSQGVGIDLSAPAGSLPRLRDELPALESALTAAGLPLLGLTLRVESDDGG